MDKHSFFKNNFGDFFFIKMRLRGFVCVPSRYIHTQSVQKKARKYTGPDVVLQRVKLDAPIQVTLYENKYIASFCQLF